MSHQSPSTGDDSGRPPHAESDHAAITQTTPRRGAIVHLLTAFFSFLLVAVPSAIGGLFFLDPILRRRKVKSGEDAGAVGSAKKDEAGFLRLDVTVDALPADGTPMAATVRDDQQDAWNLFKDVPIGSIWLRRTEAGVQIYNSICPHLGCSVNFRRGENDFFCPCHTSSFDLDGAKTNVVPPRGMDALEFSIRTDGKETPDGNEIWVKFQNFRRGVAEKIPM